MTKTEQYTTMERFFSECVAFWERTLNTDSDTDKEPYIRAIKEIPKTNPYTPCGEPFDQDVIEKFTRARTMDCYGPNVTSG